MEFYNRCSNRGPTIIIMKSEKDQLFGGYTDLPWRNYGYYQKG
jgi:hypothetical protein